MKKLTFFLLFALCTLTAQAQRKSEFDGCFATCYWGNTTSTFEMYGDVYVETKYGEHVDFFVKIVDSPNIPASWIYKTTDKPQKCGEWRFVKDKSKAKFSIWIVDEHEDFQIYFVDDKAKACF